METASNDGLNYTIKRTFEAQSLTFLKTTSRLRQPAHIPT